MTQISTKIKNLTALALTLTTIIGATYLANIGDRAQANNTAQTQPFTQDWTNVGLITTNDDWANVPGIIGYRGDDLTTATATDPQTILADGSAVVDVNANQTNPDTFATGGVTEFEIANPVVALTGSGTADAPHLVIFLNTTGRTNVNVAYILRDIDGSADDAMQQVALQYRVGATGDYTNLPAGYVADATTANAATQTTPVSVTLPAAANNQALVQVRVITTNAAGNDEWVGVDNINVTSSGGGTPTPTVTPTATPTATPTVTPTPTPTVTPTPAPRGRLYDFDGNGRTDWTTLTVATGAPIRWKVTGNPAGAAPNAAFRREFDYGLVGDTINPADYAGDFKTDVSVWRAGIYYVAQFPIGTGGITLDRAVRWGQTGDLAGSEGDYDGDGKTDYTVKRAVNGTLVWYIMTSGTNTMRAVQFGAATGSGFMPPTFPGADFTGDGRDELIILNGTGTTGALTYVIGDAVNGTGVATIPWGTANTDYAVAPADYTGDGRADLVAVRQTAGAAIWFIRNTATGTGTGTQFGIGDPAFANNDLPVRGDYDGDGRHDIAVYRRTNNFFYVFSSSNGALLTQKAGDPGDIPLANLFVF